MGMSDPFSWVSTIVDPISFGVGAAAESVDPGGVVSNAAYSGLNMFGKAGVSTMSGDSVGTSLIQGAGTDIRRAVNVFSGPVGWVAEGVGTSSDFLVRNGNIDSTTGGLVSVGSGLAGGLYSAASSSLSGASSAASTASTASTAATTASTASSALSDSAYNAAFYGTDAKVFGDAGSLTFQNAAELGTAANYGVSATAFKGSGLNSSLLNAGANATKTAESGLLDTIGKYAASGLKVGSAGMSIYGAYVGAQAAQQAAEAEAQKLEGDAELAEGKAELYDLQQEAATRAAEEEKAQLAKRARMLVGKGKVAAAANGVMLEGRAESSPAMFEQDAAMELAHEKSKIDYNLKIKNSIFAQNAALSRMSAATSRIGASNAIRAGNLNATSSWIQGLAGAGTSLASVFA